MPLELIITKDGSHSIYNPQLNETYHSKGGAIEESQYIYIDKGLSRVAQQKSEITILEVGFGTGLNAMLTLKEAVASQLAIDYVTLEPYPIEEKIIGELNYPDLLNDNGLKEKFYTIHALPWEAGHFVEPTFQLTKHKIRLEEFSSSKKFDLVYYDAFAPSKQAEIWALANLEKVSQMMDEGGILVTYCSSGQFRRDLKEAGFSVEKLPGPVGKREIIRAEKRSK